MQDNKTGKEKKAPQRYSEGFKRKVIEEYLRTGIDKMSLNRKYGIAYKSGIAKWMQTLGYEDIHRQKRYFSGSNDMSLKKKKKKNTEVAESEDVALLKEKLRKLELELEDEKLRSEAYRLTIEIAEREFKIPIGKKPSTR